MTSTERLSFVSVVFEPETPLQQLQARSFARHLDPGLAAEIVVVDNTTRGLSAPARRRLVESYGDLGDHVVVVRLPELERLRGRHGWRRQQIAKLTVSRLVSTRRYVALDAKNHLVRATKLDDFVDPGGRARGGLHSYASHPLREELLHTLRYLGASEEQLSAAVSSFATTATPFVLETDIAARIVAEIGGDPETFATQFVRHELLEFFLYSGWLELRGDGFSSRYVELPIQAPMVWPKAADLAGVQQAIARVRDTDAAFFGVHRRSLAAADRAAVEALEGFWCDRGLFATAKQARRMTSAFRRTYRLRMASARLGERMHSITAHTS